MTVDLPAAVAFIEANGRLLDRRRMQHHFFGASPESALAALRVYANPDGGFGSALEPDVRGPHSEPTAALHALEVLAELNALDDDIVSPLADWIAHTANADGGVPFVMLETARHPRAPWMVPTAGGSHVTFGLAAALYGRDLPWIERGTDWCWARLDSDEPMEAFTLKFALDFLNAIPADSADSERADRLVAQQQDLISAEGSIPVKGGTDDETLTLLDLAAYPDTRARSLFIAEQVDADLDRLESGQQDDGGWDFDWLAWSPGQAAEWRALVTLRSLLTLRRHGRITERDIE